MVKLYKAEGGNRTLGIKNLAPYETACSLSFTANVPSIVQVFAESHGDPRQRGQKECAWVTGIRVNGREVCEFRGNDLLYAKKKTDTRCGAVEVPAGRVSIEYQMRAINKVAGGAFKVTYSRLWATVHDAVDP